MQRLERMPAAAVRVGGPGLYRLRGNGVHMARGSKWSVALFAVFAGFFLGAALARQSGRETGEETSAPAIANAPESREDPVHEALQPLSADVLKARVIEVFPVGYLTLMAIIQGASFGLLFIAIQQGGFFGQSWVIHTWLTLIQSLATGLTIVIVTHEYLLLTVVVRWTPTVFDTLIPYLLGFGEIWMAIATGHATSWWLALAALCAVATFAFLHTRTRTTPGAFNHHHGTYWQNRKYIATQAGLCVGMLLTSLGAALLNSYHACSGLANICLTLGVTLVGVLILILGAGNQNRLYDRYRIPRWHSARRTA